jgi:hypothetical protein
LEGGPSGFPQDFTCPAVLGNLTRKPDVFRLRAFHPLWNNIPDVSTRRLVFDFPTVMRDGPIEPRNPRCTTRARLTYTWFRLFPFRSPLLWESSFLSLPEVTKMVQFTSLAPSGLCIQPVVSGHDPRWVPPFGHLRIKGCLHLPGAYRSLPRPSSPSGAKASPMRP